MESARAKGCPSRQRRFFAAPGEEFHSRMITPFIPLQNFNNPGLGRRYPWSLPPAWCGDPNPSVLLLIVWRSWTQRESRVAPRADVEDSQHPGSFWSHLRVRNRFISLQFQNPEDENGDFPGRYRPRRCTNLDLPG